MKYAEEIQKANGLISQAIHMLEEVTCAMMDDQFASEALVVFIEHHIGELEDVEGELESLAPTN